MGDKHDQVLVGMSVLGRLYSNDPDEQADTIALVLTGKYDEALEAVFVHTHGDNGKGMGAELKEQYRKHLQIAISNEADRLTEKQQQEACEQFMGNHEPHALGTVAELAEKYGVSKAAIRMHKREDTLEEFINERAE